MMHEKVDFSYHHVNSDNLIENNTSNQNPVKEIPFETNTWQSVKNKNNRNLT